VPAQQCRSGSLVEFRETQRQVALGDMTPLPNRVKSQAAQGATDGHLRLIGTPSDQPQSTQDSPRKPVTRMEQGLRGEGHGGDVLQ
jgi:hypothetical protein